MINTYLRSPFFLFTIQSNLRQSSLHDPPSLISTASPSFYSPLFHQRPAQPSQRKPIPRAAAIFVLFPGPAPLKPAPRQSLTFLCRTAASPNITVAYRRACVRAYSRRRGASARLAICFWSRSLADAAGTCEALGPAAAQLSHSSDCAGVRSRPSAALDGAPSPPDRSLWASHHHPHAQFRPHLCLSCAKPSPSACPARYQLRGRPVQSHQHHRHRQRLRQQQRE